MFDIWVALAIISLAFALIVAGNVKLSRRSDPRKRAGVVAACVVTSLVYIFLIRDDVRLAWLLPFSSVIVLGNAIPLIIAVIIGQIWTDDRVAIGRRLLAATGLTGVAVFATIHPLLTTTPRCFDEWSDGVCIQSTDKTCSAACAASVLRAAGIEATEHEMAELCFTGKGTLWSGLYRGLKLKTVGTTFDVETIVTDLDGLQGLKLNGAPVVLTVRLTDRINAAYPIYARQWGWVPGLSHTVLFYGFAADHRVDMGDPSVGREQWLVEDLERLWTGAVQRIVQRD